MWMWGKPDGDSGEDNQILGITPCYFSALKPKQRKVHYPGEKKKETKYEFTRGNAGFPHFHRTTAASRNLN